MVKVRIHGTPNQVQRYAQTMHLMHNAVLQLHAGAPLEDVMGMLADIPRPYLITSESRDYLDRHTRQMFPQVRRYFELEEGSNAQTQ